MNLKEKRIEKNITLAQLSEATKISKGELSRIERELSNPTLGTLSKIAKALNCKLYIEFK